MQGRELSGDGDDSDGRREMSFTPPSDGGTVDVYMDYGQPYLNLVWDDSVPENTLHYSESTTKSRYAGGWKHSDFFPIISIMMKCGS